MRIAVFTNNYKSYIGGLFCVERLAQALRACGRIVYVFAQAMRENLIKKEIDTRIVQLRGMA